MPGTHGDRRTMIDKDELRDILAEVLDDRHTCWADSDDKHDLKELLTIYRETTSTVRRWVIRGFLSGCFAVVVILAALKFKIIPK